MGIWALWTALLVLCQLGKWMMVLQQHWAIMAGLMKAGRGDRGFGELWEASAEARRLAAIVVTGVLALVALLVAGYYLSSFLFVLVVAAYPYSGTIVTIAVALLVVACLRHEIPGRRVWTDVLFLAALLVLGYYLLSFLFALVVAVYPYSATLVTIAVALLVVAYLGVERKRSGRLVWTDVLFLVTMVVSSYFLLRFLFALVVRVHHYSGLSSKTVFALVGALLVVKQVDYSRKYWSVIVSPHCPPEDKDYGQHDWTNFPAFVVVGLYWDAIFYSKKILEVSTNTKKSAATVVRGVPVLVNLHYLLGGMLALVVAIHLCWGLSSWTLVTINVALLVVVVFMLDVRKEEHLLIRQVLFLVAMVVGVYCLWRGLFTLVVAIHRYTGLSSETVFKLVVGGGLLLAFPERSK